MPYLTQLQGQFTRVVIKNISRLSRSYSIRIYELLTFLVILEND
ncbi:replication initiation protein [Escherichia coli]